MRRDRHHARTRQLAPTSCLPEPACLKPASCSLPHAYELSPCSARAGNAIHHAARPSSTRWHQVRVFGAPARRSCCLPACWVPAYMPASWCALCPSAGTALMSPCSVRAQASRQPPCGIASTRRSQDPRPMRSSSRGGAHGFSLVGGLCAGWRGAAPEAAAPPDTSVAAATTTLQPHSIPYSSIPYHTASSTAAAQPQPHTQHAIPCY
jgi:hypothetical protein